MGTRALYDCRAKPWLPRLSCPDTCAVLLQRFGLPRLLDRGLKGRDERFTRLRDAGHHVDVGTLGFECLLLQDRDRSLLEEWRAAVAVGVDERLHVDDFLPL